MSDTLEILRAECGAATDAVYEAFRVLHNDFDLVANTEAALDRLCRAHEALRQERDAEAVGARAQLADDMAHMDGSRADRAHWKAVAASLRVAEEQVRALRAPAPVIMTTGIPVGGQPPCACPMAPGGKIKHRPECKWSGFPAPVREA